jgi:hypothetical protein
MEVEMETMEGLEIGNRTRTRTRNEEVFSLFLELKVREFAEDGLWLANCICRCAICWSPDCPLLSPLLPSESLSTGVGVEG